MRNVYKVYQNEIEELQTLYHTSIIAFEQTKKIKKAINKGLLSISDNNVTENILSFPKSVTDITYTLRELVLVRLISALEVYLIDNIKLIFLETKLPFKRKELIQFDQQELLSYNSISEVFNKIINKECRQLSSGGFEKILKYYNERFDIDLVSMMPSKQLIYEYHDKRHLIVHRLGKTDKQFRDKYNSTRLGFSINHDFIVEAIKIVNEFAENVMNQTNIFLTKITEKEINTLRNNRKLLFLSKI